MSMKVETWIKKYAERTNEPDQKYCPIFGIKWKGHNKEDGEYTKIYTPHDGKIYMNETPACLKNKHGSWWSERTISPRSYGYEGLYLKMVSDRVMEIAYVKIADGSRGKAGEIRKWVYQYGSRYYIPQGRIFLDKETCLPYDVNGERLWKEGDGKYYNRDLVHMLPSLTSYGRMEPQRQTETLSKFCGCTEAPVGWKGQIIDMRYLWNLSSYIQKKQERTKTDLTQKLETYELPERDYESSTVEFQIIDDTYAVFRIFQAREDYDYETRQYIRKGKATERCRVFVNNKGKVAILKKDAELWNRTGVQLDNIIWLHSGETDNVGFDKLSEWNPIKWNAEIIESVREKKTENNKYSYRENGVRDVERLVKLLRHPVVEKLYKMGYVNLAKMLLYHDVNATLKELFYMDKINERQKNIYKMLGVNKYLLDIVEKRYTEGSVYNGSRSLKISELKELFGSYDICSLSKETTDIYMYGIEKCGYRGISDLVGCYHGRWYEPFSHSPSEEKRKLIEKLFRLEQTESGIIHAYMDAKNMYSRINNKPEIDWSDFRHLQDIVTLHDNLTGLYNAEQAERDRLRAMKEEERRAEYEKKFKKLQDDRKEKFECVGEKFSIVVPKTLTEITSEGTNLHHCVGGYLERHANGSTNILFLRQNDLPNTSFYTIEVTPDNYVVQIHGMHNRWLGNNPEAISFVWKWINDRGFRCEKYKLLDTGTGYGKNGKEVSEDYLVA